MSEQLQELLNCMVSKSEEQDARILQQQAQFTEQQTQITELLQVLRAPPPVRVDLQQPPVADAVVRAEKIQKLAINMRKSSRLKPFKVTADSDIKLFLKKFEEELKTMKAMVGVVDDLSKEEFTPIFRSCLDFPIVERVSQVLIKNGKTWENIPIADLLKLMREEFGSKQTDVANVLKQDRNFSECQA